MARIPSQGQTITSHCGFNQAASRPADPIKRHRARRERRHPKEVLTTQTCAVALDLLENGIRQEQSFDDPPPNPGIDPKATFQRLCQIPFATVLISRSIPTSSFD